MLGFGASLLIQQIQLHHRSLEGWVVGTAGCQPDGQSWSLELEAATGKRGIRQVDVGAALVLLF